MLGEKVAATCLAPLAKALWRFVIRSNVVRSAGDMQRFGFPQGEGVDRPGRPAPARLTMAIPNACGRPRDGELDRATKAAAFKCVCLTHDLFLGR